MTAGSIAARHRAQVAPAPEPCCVTWEARPKPRPASPANMSKQGLFARLYAPNQTLIMVKTELPRGILAEANGPAGGRAARVAAVAARGTRHRCGPVARSPTKISKTTPCKVTNWLDRQPRAASRPNCGRPRIRYYITSKSLDRGLRVSSVPDAEMQRARARSACRALHHTRRDISYTTRHSVRPSAFDNATTANLPYFLSEPFARHAPLKFDREKAVISSCKNMNGDVRPAPEATGLAENGFGFLAWVFGAGAQHIRRYVV
jgi:hypothetical protein